MHCQMFLKQTYDLWQKFIYQHVYSPPNFFWNWCTIHGRNLLYEIFLEKCMISMYCANIYWNRNELNFSHTSISVDQLFLGNFCATFSCQIMLETDAQCMAEIFYIKVWYHLTNFVWNWCFFKRTHGVWQIFYQLLVLSAKFLWNRCQSMAEMFLSTYDTDKKWNKCMIATYFLNIYCNRREANFSHTLFLMISFGPLIVSFCPLIFFVQHYSQMMFPPHKI
jgi:hypothetical protein